jgi:energy-coupling factor transporter ATP-binding protein EcfA2
MRIDKVHIITRFKNLADFKIDFDETSMKTVLIGLNATGKSNFLESLLIIFGTLELENKDRSDLTFDYYIKYNCRNKDIEIEYNYKLDSYKFKIFDILINTETVIENKHKKQFFKNKKEYLPKHVFIYYSGISNRLGRYYDRYISEYYKKIIKENASYEEFKEIQPIFLTQNIHGTLALLAFFLNPDKDKESLEFLNKELNIYEIVSTLFIIKNPDWSKIKKEDNILWGATGLVNRFLSDLFRFSLAPIYQKERKAVSYNKFETNELLYLFIKDQKTFDEFIYLKGLSRNQLFNALISTDLSNMLSGVKVNVKKKGVDGELSMSEFSEGEQQLLTVFGLLKFTKDEESLILLDEPDTHLNPQWKWKYIDFLDKVVGNPKTTQIIFCTHDPLVIGSLDKKEVIIFKKENNKTISSHPKISPKEMSVDKILTSELFGIPSIMSKELEDKLNAKRYLQSKIMNETITDHEKIKFLELEKYFDDINFYDTFVDSRFEQFVKLTSEYKEFSNRTYSVEEMEKLDSIAKGVLDNILNSTD